MAASSTTERNSGLCEPPPRPTASRTPAACRPLPVGLVARTRFEQAPPNSVDTRTGTRGEAASSFFLPGMPLLPPSQDHLSTVPPGYAEVGAPEQAALCAAPHAMRARRQPCS